MTLLPALLIALGVTWALGGNLRRVALLRFRDTWLVYGALGLQVVLFSPVTQGHPALVRHGQLLSYAVLLAFAMRNRRICGMTLLAMGTLSNAVAIALNGGLMPVDAAALAASGWSLDSFADGAHHNAHLMTAETRLAFLGDIFAVPRFPGAAAISVGDLLLVAGACVLVYRVCTPRAVGADVGIRGPFTKPRFVHLLAVQTLSGFASWTVAAVLVGWAYVDAGGLWGSSGVLVVRGLAGVCATWTGGRLADRFGRNRILACADATQALSLAAIVVAAETGRPLAVYAAFAVTSLAAASSEAALRAIVVGAVDGDARLLQAANGLLGTARGAVMATGAVSGGYLAARLGVQPVLTGAGVAFALTSIGYAVLRVHAPALPRVPVGRPRAPRLHTLRPVLPLVLMFGTATLATGLLHATLPHVLGRAGVGTVYGVGIGTIGAGLVVGQFVSGLLAHEQMRPRTIAVALVCMGAAAATVGASPLLATTLLALFLVGLFDGVTETVFDTLVQRDVPAHAHGAVFGSAQGIFTASMLAGFVAAPLISGHATVQLVAVGAGAVLAVAGVGGLALAGVMAVRDARSGRPAPVAAL